MPIIDSNYEPSRPWFRNAHLNTITPALWRSVNDSHYQREVLEIDDGDFLDLDWQRSGKDLRKAVIVLHGLEGSADRPYVRGTCRYFSARGWDALALNQRTCGGRMNRLPRAYHMGTTDDLKRVVDHLVSLGYQKIGLVGFSMGGNHVMKYLGENGTEVPVQLIGGVAFSVPCHIASANVEIDKWYNRPYLSRFLKGLVGKIAEKQKTWPERFDLSGPMPKTFSAFDDRYTGPLHGFSGAEEYWDKCSSRQFIPTIDRPCLLVNALDDTFLSEQCYPREEARYMDQFFLETPRYGGHVGFAGPAEGNYWSEQRAFEFLSHL